MANGWLRNATRYSIGAAIAGMMALSTAPAMAEWKPSKSVEMLIGFNAGGGADALARLVAEKIESDLGWEVVPVNRGGAGGAVMAGLLKNAAADGHTIGMGVTTTFSTNPVFSEGITYGPEDFDYLGTIALSQMVIVARASAPFSTLDEMAEHAKKNGGLTIASMGPELERVADLISGHFDIDLRVLPTRGGAEVLTQVLGEHVDLGFNGGAHHQYIKSGDMKVVVNLNEEPLLVTPDVANLRSYGIDFASNIYFQFQAPKGLPEDVKASLAAAIDKAVNSDEVREFAEKRMEMQLSNLGPERLTALIMKDAEAAKRLAGQD